MKRLALFATLFFAGCANDSAALPRVLEFHDPAGCLSCREMEPIVRQVGGIKQFDVNTREGHRMAEQWHVTVWPTFIRLNSDGFEAERLEGKHSLGRLRKFADGQRDETAERKQAAKQEKKPAPPITVAAKPPAKVQPDRIVDDSEPLRRELATANGKLDDANREIRNWHRYHERAEECFRRHGIAIEGEESRSWREVMPSNNGWSRVR